MLYTYIFAMICVLPHVRLQKVKVVKRQRNMEKKHKVIESRKSLTNLRVVQENLLFVIGLSPRLADPEVCLCVSVCVCMCCVLEQGNLLTLLQSTQLLINGDLMA